MELTAAISPLNDIEGVYGSFVVNDAGQILHRNLSVVVNDASLSSAGPRLARLWSNLPKEETPQSALLVFKSHKLFIQPLKNGNLCVLVASQIHLLELRQAAECAARFLDNAIDASANKVAPKESKSPRTVMYRGTSYEE